jgi:hypothetical protein
MERIFLFQSKIGSEFVLYDCMYNRYNDNEYDYFIYTVYKLIYTVDMKIF